MVAMAPRARIQPLRRRELLLLLTLEEIEPRHLCQLCRPAPLLGISKCSGTRDTTRNQAWPTTPPPTGTHAKAPRRVFVFGQDISAISARPTGTSRSTTIVTNRGAATAAKGAGDDATPSTAATASAAAAPAMPAAKPATVALRDSRISNASQPLQATGGPGRRSHNEPLPSAHSRRSAGKHLSSPAPSPARPAEAWTPRNDPTTESRNRQGNRASASRPLSSRHAHGATLMITGSPPTPVWSCPDSN